MKPDECLRPSLLDVTKGIADAKKRASLYVAPGDVREIGQDASRQVKFEVAVTVNAQGGCGISVLSFGDIKGSAASKTVSRVS